MVLRFEISFHLYDFVAERGSVTLRNFTLRSGTMAQFAREVMPPSALRRDASLLKWLCGIGKWGAAMRVRVCTM